MGTQAVPSQYLGYIMQLPRVLLRLLNAEEDESVALEFNGDVSVLDGGKITILSEEDKSSIVDNPIDDTSINLWKTFYNWINYINSNTLIPQKTTFVLYTNHIPSKDDLAMKMSEVDVSGISTLLSECKSRTKHLSPPSKSNQKNAYTYKEFVLNQQVNVFTKILPNFILESNDDVWGVECDIKNFLRDKAFLPDISIDSVYHELMGFILDSIAKRISQKKIAAISKKEFKKFVQDIFYKIRTKQLTDYASSHICAQNREIGEKPIYIQQLEIIKQSEEEILEATNDYINAKINRQDWIENEILEEKEINDFEKNLEKSYKNSKKEIDLIHPDFDDVRKGQLLLVECKKVNVHLAQQQTPAGTIAGTYHSMADQKRIGWHPNWENLLEGIE